MLRTALTSTRVLLHSSRGQPCCITPEGRQARHTRLMTCKIKPHVVPPSICAKVLSRRCLRRIHAGSSPKTLAPACRLLTCPARHPASCLHQRSPSSPSSGLQTYL